MKITSLLERSNSQDGLYHREIGFPKNWIDLLPNSFTPTHVKLSYGSHARQEALVDRYGEIKLPDSISFSRESGIKIIEMEVASGVVTKLVVRAPYDEDKDIIIVFQPQDGFVRTVWFNQKTDTHSTLNKAKYNIPA